MARLPRRRVRPAEVVLVTLGLEGGGLNVGDDLDHAAPVLRVGLPGFGGDAFEAARAGGLQTKAEVGAGVLEFDEALPYLVGLVEQNFTLPVVVAQGYIVPVLDFEASGSGFSRDGLQAQRALAVSIKPSYRTVV